MASARFIGPRKIHATTFDYRSRQSGDPGGGILTSSDRAPMSVTTVGGPYAGATSVAAAPPCCMVPHRMAA